MNREKTKSPRRFGWAAVLALAPTICLAQQNPGLSAQPTGRLLGSTNAPSTPSAVSGTTALDSKRAVGPEESNAEAFAQMKRAAGLGFSDAQFALGTMYFEGLGTTKDDAAALDAFRRAADGGHIEAMFAGGRILLSKTEPEMRAEGLALMNRAIENGHIEATLMLATAYGRGSLGMQKDEAEAEALLKPAAERGDADCQLALASLYKFGDSFAARREAAQVWLQRAADQGHPKALEILRSEPEER